MINVKDINGLKVLFGFVLAGLGAIAATALV